MPRLPSVSSRRMRRRVLPSAAAVVVLAAGLASVPGHADQSPSGPALDDPVDIAPGVTMQQFQDAGPVEGHLLTVDLSETSLAPAYLTPGDVAEVAPTSQMADAAGAAAAVNADFFDIHVSGAARGSGIADGLLLHGQADSRNHVVAFSADDAGGHVGRVDQVHLDASATPTDADPVAIDNLNSPVVAEDGVGLYDSEWGEADRSTVVEDGETLREVHVVDGEVDLVDDGAGDGEIAEDTVVLLGQDAGAEALQDLDVGDAVDVEYEASHGGDDIVTAVGGNVVLVENGEVVAPDDDREPRTAAGFSDDGVVMYLAVVDGRSDASVGMTYVELAEFMRDNGSENALNLDGGGSTTMAVQLPGDDATTVVNNPSDADGERHVTNGLGLLSGSDAVD